MNRLCAFAENHQIASPTRVWQILDRTCAALTDMIAEVEAYAIDRLQLNEVGGRTIKLWLERMPKEGAS